MSDGYWRRRSEEYEREWQGRCQSELERELARYFQESLREIEDDIAALYGRFAKDNQLSNAEARRIIRGTEFREWRMTLEEYVATAATDSAILRELNTLAMRSRISRLEKLYSETLRELQRLGERSESAVADFLTTAYRERYYHGVFDLATVGKIAIPVSKVEPVRLEKVLAARWQGGNYSTRIWENTAKLSKVLKLTIEQGIHRGLSVQKMARAIDTEMNKGYKNAERLVRTELNFVQNHAALESMESAGLKEYEFIAVLDHRTSQRCQSLDGTVYLIEEYDPGTNAPPMHPRCRSTISAVISEGTRTAKVKGRNIRVPADMKYGDFKAVYIDKTVTLKAWQIGITAKKRLAVSANGLKSADVDNKIEQKSMDGEANDVHITREQIFNADKISINVDGFGEAHIPTAKLTKYALNPERDANKARAFELALGYNLDNVELLVEEIKKNINNYPMKEQPDLGYGRRFCVTMEIVGANGKTAKVTIAWILDNKTGEFRLTSLYVDK